MVNTSFFKQMNMQEWEAWREGIFSKFRTLERTNSHKYPRLCLKLQREVRDLSPMFLTANAAMLATPPQYQVRDVNKLKRGMVGYSADFTDSNKADHIYGIAGRTKPGRIVTWSNDVREVGAVDKVFLDFYRVNWGDPFRFGTWWLNGVYFGPPVEKPKPDKVYLGRHYVNVIHDLQKIRNQHAKDGHKVLAEALTEDIQTMKERHEEWSED